MICFSRPHTAARPLPWIVPITLLLIGFCLPAFAERGDDAERKSKNGHSEGTIDGVTVSVDYGRPETRGRDIFGGLVPFGKVWRTGADEATNITFGGDVMVEGEPLAAGTYSLFTIPGEVEWTVIFNKVAEQWGAYDYADDQDALRIAVEPTQDEIAEVLTVSVRETDVSLHWAETAVAFSVAAGE